MSNRVERSRGTIRFGFKTPQKELEKDTKKEHLLYMFFSYGRGKRLKYSTGFKTSWHNWDAGRNKIRKRADILNSDAVNTHLRDLENKFSDRFEELQLTDPNITPKQLKRELDIITEKIKVTGQPEYLSFFEVIDRFLDEKKGRVTNVTLRSYKQTKKRLEEFEKAENTTLDWSSFDMGFYSKFTRFMESENYSLNTIGKHIKSLKTFLNYSVDEGFNNNLKFRNNSFKATKEITTEIYLTEDEIEAFRQKDLTKYPNLEKARDIFLIGCYTGQRVSDYNSFKEEDIISIDGVDYFKIVQKKNRKSGRKVLCPITKEIREIMDKRYEGKPPKRIPAKDLNDFIKQVGQMLEMDSLNQKIKCEYTKGGEFQTEYIEKYNLIKSHTARRSFCTNKYKAGMSVYDIMLFSGHTTEKEFYKYIRIKEEERATHIAKNGYFNL